MRLSLKKILISLAVISSILGAQHAVASDKKLSRSCLKNNPLVVNETDENLINIYEAYCDKKNADAKYSYLAKAAQRFQQIGQNFKALEIINELEALNLQGNTITDVKFLASANLANSALSQMRSIENRYLTSDGTYPIAKQLSKNIESAKSTIILKMEEPPQAQQKRASTSTKARTSTVQTSNKANVKKVNTSTTKSNAPSTPAKTGSGNPFGFTQK